MCKNIQIKLQLKLRDKTSIYPFVLNELNKHSCLIISFEHNKMHKMSVDKQVCYYTNIKNY